MFITFEGGEGTGKSTQIKLLAARLSELDMDVVLTREPGGTPQAEALRNLLVSGDVTSWSAEAEALLNYAARDSHLNCLIRPALARGATVLCDRFMDSTRAYQAFAGDCPISLIDSLQRTIVGDTKPNLTFIFDLAPEVGLTRAKARAGDAEDRFERKGLSFHKKLHKGFLEIALAEPLRCKLIDANQTVENVASDIWDVFNGR
jgi:dTMP kinase